ncbi:marine proteobacterial sortase target protein [Enterovibrio sp. ZSDZ35]|uniref:Marine proteobacterial sortase target protein n=1 Tax=Enterovibrio qingdaonensis TaxID=2899818 RepID=A0ABT5QI72_9GAMM|nr:marine proteobacterial sortase target protein [Enterovibrio sp. ZSDZ35]MDD1780673.1 marine proteobacterial sortase target protein [Enterovibrio sp. ZSDZ35]
MYSLKLFGVRFTGALGDWSLAVVLTFVLCASVQATEKDNGLYLQPVSEEIGQWTQAPQLSTDADMVINGIVNRATVTQAFTNPTEQWVHARYVFPLPQNASVDRLYIRVGERIIEGEIQPKQKARDQFELAASQGKKASLIEQHRSNLFSTAVSNIAPGETIHVTIEYQEIVAYQDGEFSLRFPTTFTHRYVPTTQSSPLLVDETLVVNRLQNGWAIPNSRVPDANAITPEQRDPMLEDPISFNLSIDINMGLPIADINSDTASLNITEISPSRYSVSLSESDIANRDFVLSWSPQSGSEPAAAMFIENREDAKYGLLMMVPPSVNTEPLKKNTTFVLDVSGSMYGEAIEQAKEAVIYGLSKLGPDDHFNIIYFNDQAYRISDTPLQASLSNIGLATHVVEQLNADGGTEMLSAIDAAFSIPTLPDALNQIVFVTDGAIANESELYTEINRGLGDRRLFTVGIGSAPNTSFMQRAALAGKGTFTHIGNLNNVSKQLERLFQKLSSPVLHSLSMTWEDGSTIDAWPNPIPDLYSQQPLVQVFRFDGENKMMSISGRLQDSEWKQDIDTTTIMPSEASGLNVLWARMQIESVRLNPAIADSVREKTITDLGLKHHIVTKYTSLIAIEKTPSRPAESNAEVHVIKPMPPKGSQSTLLQSGLGSDRDLYLGLFLLIMSLIGFTTMKYKGDHDRTQVIKQGAMM